MAAAGSGLALAPHGHRHAVDQFPGNVVLPLGMLAGAEVLGLVPREAARLAFEVDVAFRRSWEGPPPTGGDGPSSLKEREPGMLSGLRVPSSYMGAPRSAWLMNRSVQTGTPRERRSAGNWGAMP
jgi:hypothetical protein